MQEWRKRKVNLKRYNSLRDQQNGIKTLSIHAGGTREIASEKVNLTKIRYTTHEYWF